ncbi:MAG: restriction endonuclease subunit S [Faecalibacterium prausnitzii]
MTTVKMVKLGTLIKPAKLQKCGNDDYPVLSMTMHNGLVFQSDKFKKSVASQDKSTYKVVHRNQLVIGFPIDEGVLATQRITDAGIVSPAYGIWDVDQTKIIPEFLEYALRCNRAIDYYKAKLRGSTARRRSLPTPTLLELDVPLPDIEQQKLALTTIHHAKNALDSRQAQLTKLDELVKARFVEMFGDPVKNTMDWEIKSLSELGELNRGVSKARPRNSPELLGGPYPLIQTGEVANAKTYITSFNSTYSEKGLAQSKMWPKGTLCITIAANIAQTSILTFDACFPDSVVGFISRNMTNELFIHYWFSFFQKILDEQAPQVAQKNINLKILSELNVIVPPLSLQNQFAAFVAEVDKSKVEVQKALDQTQLLFDSLMQQYFG